VVKDGFVAAAGNLQDEGFVGALGLEVGFDAFAQIGSIDADDVVDASVVALVAAEDLAADLLLGDLFAAFSEGAVADIEEKLAHAGSALELRAGEDTLQEGPTLFGVECCLFL
jgi:hypothetical protein